MGACLLFSGYLFRLDFFKAPGAFLFFFILPPWRNVAAKFRVAATTTQKKKLGKVCVSVFVFFVLKKEKTEKKVPDDCSAIRMVRELYRLI